jgi:3-methyladenine DNA glycosylase AlkD
MLASPMATKKQSKRIASKGAKKKPETGVDATELLDEVVAQLRARASEQVKTGMARYGIPSDKALGIPVGALKSMGKRLGRNHALAAALWETDIYEARLLATFVDEPELVTAAQMDAWARQFDNWAVCDTACFALFDRTPHAFSKVAAWGGRKEEFVKRAAFALLASLTVHDKAASDDAFLRCLPLIERAATDQRNFVMKSVNWALRSVGKRSPVLHAEALSVCRRLAALPEPAPRWVGKNALRELESASVLRRLKAKGTSKPRASGVRVSKVKASKTRTVRARASRA